MTSLSFRFNYKRVGALDNDTKEVKDYYYPFIPCILSSERKTTREIDGLLDSGSDGVVINRSMADMLELKLKNANSIRVAGSKIQRSVSNISIKIGRAGRFSQLFENVQVSVIEGEETPVIIGRDPIFRFYRITFIEPEHRLEFAPYEKK